jgi:hypothetical protein
VDHTSLSHGSVRDALFIDTLAHRTFCKWLDLSVTRCIGHGRYQGIAAVSGDRARRSKMTQSGHSEPILDHPVRGLRSQSAAMTAEALGGLRSAPDHRTERP